MTTGCHANFIYRIMLDEINEKVNVIVTYVGFGSEKLKPGTRLEKIQRPNGDVLKVRTVEREVTRRENDKFIKTIYFTTTEGNHYVVAQYLRTQKQNFKIDWELLYKLED